MECESDPLTYIETEFNGTECSKNNGQREEKDIERVYHGDGGNDAPHIDHFKNKLSL
jgi:hypothetical protein